MYPFLKRLLLLEQLPIGNLRIYCCGGKQGVGLIFFFFFLLAAGQQIPLCICILYLFIHLTWRLGHGLENTSFFEHFAEFLFRWKGLN